MTQFDPLILEPEDFHVASQIVGGMQRLANPDLVIAPDGNDYLYRWYLIPRRAAGANAYLHIQVASDPERPLHDHPWDNQSVILAGGYDEILHETPPWGPKKTLSRVKGDVVQRKATEAHRLILPAGVPYTMTLFTTGPVIREWGFWLLSHRGRPEWVPHSECLVEGPDGRSLFKEPAL